MLRATNTVDEINAEIARLERQRDEALKQVEEVEQRLAALDEQRILLWHFPRHGI